MAIRRYGKKGARCQGRYHKGKGFVVYGALAFSYGYCTAFTSQEFKHQHPNSPGPLKSPRSQGSTASFPTLPPTGFHIGQNATPPPPPSSSFHFPLFPPSPRQFPFPLTTRLPTVKLSLATPQHKPKSLTQGYSHLCTIQIRIPAHSVGVGDAVGC